MSMDVRVPRPKARPLEHPHLTWARFAEQMMTSRDIDPVYPVLAELNAQEPAEDALWRTLCYVALYHIGASEVLFYNSEAADGDHRIDPELIRELAPKAGTERRGLRSAGFLEVHLRAILSKRERFGSLDAWLRTGHTGDPRRDWTLTFEHLQNVPYNGRWAAFKTCDVLAETHGWPIEAPDAGHRFSTGPREGLTQLVEDGILEFDLPSFTDQSNAAIDRLDRATEQVQRGLWLIGNPVKVSEVETLLCNWHALRHRHYYVGHDIDEMLERVLWVEDKGIQRRLLKARRAALPVETLGEVQGWAGRRKELMGMLP